MANSPGKVGSFLRGVRSEFRKVVWPNNKETVRYTTAVITISIIVSLIVYVLDLAFASIINLAI